MRWQESLLLLIHRKKQKLSMLDQNLMGPSIAHHRIRTYSVSCCGHREREISQVLAIWKWIEPWVLVDRNHHGEKAGKVLCPLLSLLVILDLFRLTKTYIFNDLQITSPIVLGNVLGARQGSASSGLTTRRRIICSLIFDPWYLPIQETQETLVRSLRREDSLEEEIVTHSSILARIIP